ncbi:MAG: hypothetical protein C0506_11465 [Anaerolinea sp.]|nr:hypothetical protein [Anaerolinea sp.]
MEVDVADLLAPGLWWLHGTRGSNVYLVEADDGQLALIDTGFASSADAIVAELNMLGLLPRLASILLTHMHLDHAGSAGRLRRLTGARLIVGRGDCFERDGQLLLRTRVGRTHIAHLLTGRRTPAPVDVAITGETEVLPGIRAVPAPGHTAGSVCYVLDRLGAAFVGDLVISHGGELTRAMRLANQDDTLYLETMKRFALEAPEKGLPGHGVPVLDGFGDALRTLAALPRRRGGPRLNGQRFARLVRFGRGMSRERTPRGTGRGD